MHSEIIPDGRRWKVVVAVSMSELGPQAVKALGQPGLKTTGLTKDKALEVQNDLEPALSEVLNRRKKK